MSGFRSFLVHLLLFLTGLVFLICITAWIGILDTITGSTPATLCLSLAVLATGIGAGSILVVRSRIIHANGWRTFGVLQLVIAVYVSLTPFLSGPIQAICSRIQSLSWTAKAIPALGLLFLPSAAIGMMLPVLVGLYPFEQRAKRAAYLFGAKAAGAMVGILLAVYALLPALGINKTLLVCAVLNATIGLIAFVISRNFETKNEASQHIRLSQPLYLLFFLSAFAWASYSILCTRALIMVFGPSVYTVTSMVAVLVLGLALGGISYSGGTSHHVDAYQIYSLIQFRIALSVLFFIGVFMRTPFFLHRFFQSFSFSFGLFQLIEFLMIFVLLFYGAFFAGAAFPSALRFFEDGAGKKGRSADIYGYSTIGIAAGFVVTVFFLIPLLGFERSLRVAALLHLILGIFCFRKSAPLQQQQRVLMIGAAVLGLLLFLPAWNRSILNAGFYAQQSPNFTGLRSLQDTKILFYSEGINDAVGVTEAKGIRRLIINGKPDASNDRASDLRTGLLMAHLPALVLGEFEKTLLIGLGSGVTAGALAEHHPVRIDCVENEKQVAHAAQYFVEENRGVLNKKNFHLIFDDERDFVQCSGEQYDLIVSGPNTSANLLTRDFFALCQQRLRHGGAMCQAFSLSATVPADVAVLLRTFHSIFPHIGIWTGGRDLILIGAKQPVSIMPAAIAWQLQSPDVRQSFEMGNISLNSLRQDYIGDERIIQLFPQDPPLHTDDRPVLAFSRPRSIFADRTNEILQMLRNH